MTTIQSNAMSHINKSTHKHASVHKTTSLVG